VGTGENIDKVKFSPVIMGKDVLIGTLAAITIILILITNPIITIDVENYNHANPLVSPVHIQPE
jgi:quinol-cytochrome oxidoreductase complex cytochrome b subunit